MFLEIQNWMLLLWKTSTDCRRLHYPENYSNLIYQAKCFIGAFYSGKFLGRFAQCGKSSQIERKLATSTSLENLLTSVLIGNLWNFWGRFRPFGTRESETWKEVLQLIWYSIRVNCFPPFLFIKKLHPFVCPYSSSPHQHHQPPPKKNTVLRAIPTMTFQNSHVRFYVSLIVSGEGRHTTHLLKSVRLVSTSQTDWRQSSDILSDISFDILSDIVSDILSGISPDILSGILSDISSDILSDISCDILSDISSNTVSDILSGISHDILSGILSDISSDILSDTSSNRHFVWHSFWHILWHSFWHFFWHSFWHSVWYSFWHNSWHSVWHSFWHIFWHSVWYSFWHSVWHSFWHSFWHFFWHFFWHSFWHSFWHIFWHSISRLRSGREHWAQMVAVEVRQGTSTPGRSWGPAGTSGWGPAGNTGRGWSRWRSGREHSPQRVAVEVRQGTLGVAARGWGLTTRRRRGGRRRKKGRRRLT